MRKLRKGVGTDSEIIARQYASVLLVLTGLFAFRVIAQLVQFVYPVNFLPPYAVWHSGALLYVELVAVQGLILLICVRIVWNVKNRTIIPSRRQGIILFTLGIIYLVSMCIRLIVGLTIAPDHFWFGATVPTVFHLVLASFVMFYGRFHCRGSQSLSPIDRE